MDLNLRISSLFCTKCGERMYVPRMNNKKREPNHIKHMYCPHCKEETAHIEVRDNDKLMPIEYYLRKPLDLEIKNIQAYCSGEFLNNEARSLLVFVTSKNGKKYLELDVYNKDYFKNRYFTKEEIKEIRNQIQCKLLDKKNSLKTS